MIRTQIQLTDKQAKTLQAMAKQQRVSMAELIRRSIDRYIQTEGPVPSDEERRRRAMALVGRFPSGLSDISTNHDEYLEDAYMDWQEKRSQRGNLR